MNQPVGGAVDAEFIVGHMEPRPVDEILTDMLSKEDAPPKTGQVFFDRDVSSGQPAAGKYGQVVQETMNEDFEHGEASHGANRAFGQRFPESAPTAKHAEEQPARSLDGIGFGCLSKIDLGQDFHHRAAPRRDDADVVARCEVAVLVFEHLPREVRQIGAIFPAEPDESIMLAERAHGMHHESSASSASFDS